jgi:hypothetical protein
MSEDANRGLLMVLSGVWIALVSGYMIWCAASDAGLYRWLADLQVAQGGGYYPKWTAILPALLLCSPALWYLRRQADVAQASQPAGPAAEGARMGRTARNMGIAGVVAGLIGVGAYGYAQSVPDGSEEAIPFNVSVLGTGAPVPSHKIRVTGAVDPDATTGVTESGGSTDSSTMYAGFRPDDAGGAKDAPLRLFVERRMGGAGDAATLQGFLPDQEGYLVENGLPALALRDLEARRIPIATPHYVLHPGDSTRRDPYYVAAALGGLLCAVCLIVALIGARQARSRMSRA